MFSHRRAISGPVVEKFFRALHEDEGKKMKIGVAAYCWGAGYALMVASKTAEHDAFVDAMYTAHPSLTSRADFEIVTKPLSIAVGTLDTSYKEPSRKETQALFE